MDDAPAEGQKVLYLCISVFLVLMAGLMSGLTLGLMSLDQVDLEVYSWTKLLIMVHFT